ncbi:hypothetical protein CONLIGDRAFT_223605 [Coniochaeta ligniaria NRRL 30616]|uniref:Uncharacterized protein n=1 Tax=Coniochaeta ligniaria NRRL 30616 TaxID=1408157 RepID=A0A1J7IZS3_9PEZI|nr:hypothetical protein CONLIGDRAFT_223605 [Coniochaeta ligniaria NRRL 30616]
MGDGLLSHFWHANLPWNMHFFHTNEPRHHLPQNRSPAPQGSDIFAPTQCPPVRQNAELGRELRKSRRNWQGGCLELRGFCSTTSISIGRRCPITSRTQLHGQPVPCCTLDPALRQHPHPRSTLTKTLHTPQLQPLWPQRSIRETDHILITSLDRAGAQEASEPTSGGQGTALFCPVECARGSGANKRRRDGTGRLQARFPSNSETDL